MSELQLISRAVIVENNKILLVKKINANFWHYPGGKWEFKKESLTECASREVKEETGYDIIISDLIFFQEIRKSKKIYVELFWKAKMSSINSQKNGKIIKHISKDKDINQIRWFKLKDLGNIKILPKEIIS